VPQPERIAQGLRVGLRDRALEADGVDAVRVQAQLVAAAVRDDLGAVAVEQPAQLGDVELDHLGRGRGRIACPQAFDQRVDRHRRVRAEREDCQQRPLFRGAERDRPAVDGRLDRPEQLKLHAVS
jgi:hypothetical protein